MPESHVCRWEKTGGYFATQPERWVWTCEDCHAVGVAADGQPVESRGIIRSEKEWEEHFGNPMRRRRTNELQREAMLRNLRLS